MVLDYLQLSHYIHMYMLLQKFKNGNLHQLNNFKVRKKTEKHIRFLGCILNMLNFKRLALIATEI